MKMAFMSFFEGRTKEIIEILKEGNIENYVQWDEIKGQSTGYRPRMGNDVWPGHNGAVQFPIEDDRVPGLCKTVTKFNEAAEYEGISLFVFNIDCMVVKKPKKRD